MKISELNLVKTEDKIEHPEELVPDAIEATSVYCDLCGEPFRTDEIVTDNKHGVEIVYYDCPQCQTRHDFAFEDKGVKRVKDKIRLAQKITYRATLELEKETLRAKSEYYAKEYESLSNEEKDMVGEYVPYMTKERYKELTELEKAYKYGIKDLMKLL